MPPRYTHWARLATKGAKEHTFGQYHLIPHEDRWPSSETHSLCGKLGIVHSTLEGRPIWHQRCKNCIRLKYHPYTQTPPKPTSIGKIVFGPYTRKQSRS